MSEEEPKTPTAEPVLPGFVIDLGEDGRWSLNAKGESPWFVTGFESSEQAHGWVLDYLTTNIENSNRIHVESQERRHEAELAQKQALVEAFMWSEAASKERKKH